MPPDDRCGDHPGSRAVGTDARDRLQRRGATRSEGVVHHLEHQHRHYRGAVAVVRPQREVPPINEMGGRRVAATVVERQRPRERHARPAVQRPISEQLGRAAVAIAERMDVQKARHGGRGHHHRIGVRLGLQGVDLGEEGGEGRRDVAPVDEGVIVGPNRAFPEPTGHAWRRARQYDCVGGGHRLQVPPAGASAGALGRRGRRGRQHLPRPFWPRAWTKTGQGRERGGAVGMVAVAVSARWTMRSHLGTPTDRGEVNGGGHRRSNPGP